MSKRLTFRDECGCPKWNGCREMSTLSQNEVLLEAVARYEEAVLCVNEQNEPLTLEQLRNLSTPCCLWLIEYDRKAEPIIFNGVVTRSNSNEEIVKWVTVQAHFACTGVHKVNDRLFFYLTEVHNA